ncbi:hypothetical protein LTR85_004436 [Meristemomyces frigidus]|nr:hypothetical protein LTR85_004436 [Meristemomyces frigidus]
MDSNFPWMDPSGQMRDLGPGQLDHSATSVESLLRPNDAATAILETFHGSLPMADAWCQTIAKLDLYFAGIKEDFQKSTEVIVLTNMAGGTGLDYRASLSLREGGHGGGLAEYSMVESALNDFGSLRDEK